MIEREHISNMGERIYELEEVNAVSISVEFKDGSQISINKLPKQITVYNNLNND